MKIMVVDDDGDMRSALGIRLRASGYETVFAADGVAAIAEAQKERPDVILLDLGLPAGDGFLAMERLGRIPRLASIPVIVITARDPASVQERAAGLGAVGLLHKPFENEDLLREIRSALENRAGGGSARQG